MNFSTTMRAVNALTHQHRHREAETGSSGGLGMNMRTTPASITSDPSTASLPIEPVSHALTLALALAIVPTPSTVTDALNEYQSNSSVPSSVAIVPPDHDPHAARDLDMSMHAVLLTEL